jgi:hypothetical protein
VGEPLEIATGPVVDPDREWMTISEIVGAEYRQGMVAPGYFRNPSDVASVHRAVRKLDVAGLVETKLMKRRHRMGWERGQTADRHS